MYRVKFMALTAWLVFVSVSCGQQSPATNSRTDKNLNQASVNRAKQAARKLENAQQFLLKYKFQSGEEVRWNVEHSATTKTQIAGNSESTSSRSKSTKLWKVSNVDKLGNITFVHSVENSSLWQQIGDDDPVMYDSRSDKEVPQEFSGASQMIGKPLAIVTITPSGKVVDRKSSFDQLEFGIGDICIPMPEKPVAQGYRWFVPTEFNATDEDGKRLKLKARLHYELSKFVNGQAYISFRTEVLTPVESEQVRSQLLQKLNRGYLAFDIENGRLSKREIEWNEKVQEFSGVDSFLHYIGKMTEQIVKADPANPRRVSKTAPKIKGPNDKPIIRK